MSDSYEYIVFPSEANDLEQSRIAREPSRFYRILDTRSLHLVHFPQQALTAYAFYERVETPGDQLVKSSSHRATILARSENGAIHLAASVPDIGWKSDVEALRQRGLSYASGSYNRKIAPVHRLKLVLRGKWRLSQSAASARARIEQSETHIELDCQDGLGTIVRLHPEFD